MPQKRGRSARPRGNKPDFAALTAVAGSVLWLVLWEGVRLNPYLAWLAAWGAVTFALYWWDKRQSRIGGWRVPEMVMHVAAVIGGFLGGWLGRFWCRHKTRDAAFRNVLLLSTVAHMVALGVVLLPRYLW